MSQTAACFVPLLVLALLNPLPAAAAPLPGPATYPVNGVQNPPASFSSLAAAATYLSANGISGGGQVILELRAGYPGEIAPLTLPDVPGSGPFLGVTIRPGPGYNAHTYVDGSAAGDWAIRITGSYITLDGRSGGTGFSQNWTISALGTSAPVEGRSAVRIDGTAGLNRVTVRNCTLQAQKNDNLGATLLLTGGTFNAVSNISLISNVIQNAADGNCQIGLACRGAAQAGNIGLVIQNNVIRDFSWRGLDLEGGFPGAVITGNQLTHSGIPAGPGGAADCAAIYFASSSGTGTTIAENFIYTLQVDTGVASVSGIRIGLAPAAGAPLRIHTNRVNLNRWLASSLAFWGIIEEAGIPAGAPIEIDYNSVVLAGNHPPGATTNSAAFRRESASALRLRNNIFMNARNNTGGTGTHWAISVANAASIVEIGHNDYFANAAGGVLGTTDNTPAGNRLNLGQWQTAVPADMASLEVDPAFTNYSANPPAMTLSGPPNRMESGGVAVPGITLDFENEFRHGSPGYNGLGTAPDIGADEVPFAPYYANDLSAVSLDTPVNGGTMPLASAVTPQATFKNSGYQPQSAVPVRYRMLGPLPTTTEVYNASAVIDGPLNPGASQQVTFAPVTIMTPGSYTLDASSELAGDNRAGNDHVTGTVTVPPRLAGTYDVGAGRPDPFNSLSSALARLVQVGASGPVTFALVNNTYGASTGETFPIVVNHYTGESAVNSLTIRPSPGAVPVISGSGSSILEIRGVDYVTINGSSNAGSNRGLTIQNTNAATNSAVVWARPLSGTDGVSHFTIKNVIVQGAAANQTLFGIGFGGTTISPVIGGSGHDFNRIQNCTIRRVQTGVYLAGSAADRNEDNTVEGNDIGGSSASDRLLACGVLLRYEDRPSVLRNLISGVRYGAANSGGAAMGISLGLSPAPDPTESPAAEVRDALVAENQISDIRATNWNDYSAIGIAVGGATTGVNHIRNNAIQNIDEQSVNGAPHIAAGIYVGSGTAPPEIVFNSISLSGARSAQAQQPSFAIAIDGATPAATLQSNIFQNTQTTTGPARAYAVGLDAAVYTQLASDGNVFHTSQSPADGFSVVGGLFAGPPGERTSLAAWRSETGRDGTSLYGDPLFSDLLTDLHINTTGPAPSPAANAAVPIAGLLTDLDGDARSSTPDIGADEFTTYNLSLGVTGAGSVTKLPDYPTYNPGTSVTLTAAPAGTFTGWSGDASGTTNPLVVTMSGPKSIGAQFSGSSGVSPGEEVFETFLAPVRPEPGGRGFLLSFGLARAGAVQLDLFDLNGRRVRSLLDEPRAAGRQALRWDGRTDAGQRAAGGVYWVRLRSGQAAYVQKIVVRP